MTFYPTERLALFIDGANFFSAAKASTAASSKASRLGYDPGRLQPRATTTA